MDRRVDPNSNIEAVGPDITERDNSVLALAVSRIYPAFSELFDRGGIDEKEFIRVVYRMAGESQPPDAPAMKRKPLKAPGGGASQTAKSSKTDAADVPEPIIPDG